MTKKQRELARHALGLPNKKKTTYRNHFCVGEGCDDYQNWEDLVSKKLAYKRSADLWGGDDMFYLTLNGARLALMPGEKINPEDAKNMKGDPESDDDFDRWLGGGV